MRKCGKCEEEIKEHDEIVFIDDSIGQVYHQKCIKLYPIHWAVYDGEEFLGTTEEFDAEAYNVLSEGEYEEEEE